MNIPIISSYMYPPSLFVACCELYESCLHATPAGHWTRTSASAVYFFRQQSAWRHFVWDLLQYYNSSCGQSSPRGRVVYRVAKWEERTWKLFWVETKWREMFWFYWVKKEFSMVSGFQSLAHSLYWDRSTWWVLLQRSLVSVQRHLSW